MPMTPKGKAASPSIGRSQCLYLQILIDGGMIYPEERKEAREERRVQLKEIEEKQKMVLQREIKREENDGYRERERHTEGERQRGRG